jgi:hypothetical protein
MSNDSLQFLGEHSIDESMLNILDEEQEFFGMQKIKMNNFDKVREGLRNTSRMETLPINTQIETELSKTLSK